MDRAAWDEADRLNEQGRALGDDGRADEAAAFYRQAVERCPQYEPAWFNLGVYHKLRAEWLEAYECSRRAAELGESFGDSSAGEPAWWNLGIAATALRDWRTAKRAWRKYGIDVPDGEASGDEDREWRTSFGLTPIRLDPAGAGEVVWCERIDPARAIVRNIPLPDSGRRWGEIVLHDGVPNGERVLQGKPCPVFDELALWQPSDIPTLQVEVEAATDADAEALAQLFFGAGLAAEDWTTSVKMICQACSTGRVDAEHTHAPEALPDASGPVRRFGLAASPAAADSLLKQWVQDGHRKARRHSRPTPVV